MTVRRWMQAWRMGVASILIVGGIAALVAVSALGDRSDRERVPAQVLGGTLIAENDGYRVRLTVDYSLNGQSVQDPVIVAPESEPLATQEAAQIALDALIDQQTTWVEYPVDSPGGIRHSLAEGAIMDGGASFVISGGALLVGLFGVMVGLRRHTLLEVAILLVMNTLTAIWLSGQLIAMDWSVDLVWGATSGTGIYLPLFTVGAAFYAGMAFGFTGSLRALYQAGWRRSLWHITGATGFLLGIVVMMGLYGSVLAVVMDERALNALELGL